MNLDVSELLSMSEDEIRVKYKHADFLIQMIENLRTTSENDDILKQLIRCPRCRSAIDKIDG